MIGEVAPVEQNRHTGDFPVTRRGVFTGRELVRPGVCADHFCVAVHTGSDFTCRTFMRFHQAQTGQVWQVQWALTANVRFAFGTGFCDMAHSVGTDITKAVSIFCSADAE
ncbi:hypothetical protein D3C76_1336210 [compost metagenome]